MKNIVVALGKVNSNTLIEYSIEIDKINREKFNNDSKLLTHLSSLCILKLIDIKNIKLDESILRDLSKLVKEEKVNYKLKSRLADILWLKSKEKIDYLKIAIENYMRYPLNIIFQNEWDRAISLLVSTKQDIESIKEKLLETFKESMNIDSIFIDFLNKYNRKVLQYDNNLLSKICDNKLNNFTTSYEKQDFLERYIEFYNDKDLMYSKLINYYAETIKENNLNETLGYAKIINCLNKIQNKQKYNVPKKLQEFQNKKIEFQRNMDFQMTREPIDTCEYIKETEGLLKDKTTIEIVHQLASFEDNIINILENIQEYDENEFLESISGNLGVFNKDGRKTLENLSLREKYYSDYINLFLYSRIFPTLKILSNRDITQQAILELCQKASFIPNDRIKTWSKGLYYGFKEDFIISTSLLSTYPKLNSKQAKITS